MISKIKINIREHKIFLFSTSVILLVLLYYLSISTYNVPFMDYWRFLSEIGEKIFSGTLKFSDFWIASAGIHRNPLMYLLLIINIYAFSWNTQLDIFLGAIVIALLSFVLYNKFNKIATKVNSNTQILFLPLLVILFNFNQWEILTLEFSLTFMIRIFLYYLIFIMLDDSLNNIELKPSKLIFVSAFISFAICFVSQGYFISLLFSVISVLILHFIINYHNDKLKHLKYYILACFFILLGVAFYLIGIPSVSNTGMSKALINSFIDGSFFQGVLIMMGSSVIHFAIADKLGGMQPYLISGFIVFIIYVTAILIYFKQKMYKYTFFPILLILYSLLNIVAIFYARANTFNLLYLSSSRYVCETNFGLVGVSWICISYLLKYPWQQKINIKRFIVCLPLIFIIVMLSFACFFEMREAPYRKQYYINLAQIMLNIDQATDTQLASFQSGNPNLVRDGVRAMEKYKLGIFRATSNSKLSESDDIGYTLKNTKVTGWYDDGWLGKTIEFRLHTGKEGKVVVTGYYPNKITGNETGTIYIDDTATNFKISDANFTIDLAAKPDDIVNVKIESNFVYVPPLPDTRELSFLLIDARGR